MKSYNGVKGFIKVAVLALTMLLWGNVAYAGALELPEGTELKADETESVLASITEDTQGYEQADTGSGIIAELQKGQKVLLVLEKDENWCQVLYQQKKMYVQKKYLQAVVDEEAAKEIQELEAVRASQAEQDVMVRKEIMRGRIWGVVIAILIAGIFIAGIIAVIHSNEGEDRKKNANELK